MDSLNFKDKESQNMRQKRRKVIVYEYQRNSKTKIYEKIECGVGEFHQFGICIEEDQNGFSNFSIAIIEMPDGTVLTPCPHMIKFVNDESESGYDTN